ncbi:MAG: ABC transporter permease [Anaerolineae bacterium]|nr:ABC transporter permease [Anaerolineae bacterium]
MRRTITILVLPALLFIFIFFVLPLLFLLAQSVQDPETGRLTLAGYGDFFQRETSQIIYVRTLRLGLTITIIDIVLAYPASYFLARMPARRRTLAMSLVILPLMTNPVARTYAWLIILGRTGLINNVLLGLGLIDQPARLIFTEGAIILGLAQLFLPLMILSLVSAMENIPEDIEQAARSLGANSLTTFLRVIVPLSADGLVLGATLVFTGSITAYVTPVILGGNRMLMLSTLLRQRALMAFDEQGATVVAVVMIATALAVNLIVRLFRPKPAAQR